ncbi:MAG: hypothetical protein ACLQNE_16800 [Thermoguttaceae bacterium]
MPHFTQEIVPSFDFGAAEQISIARRLNQCIEAARTSTARIRTLMEAPLVPELGASAVELTDLESELAIPLPFEYRQFLSQCRYFWLGDGRTIAGFHHEGLYIVDRPWLSTEHLPGHRLLAAVGHPAR